MNNINISVANRIAVADAGALIVCNNKDYQITFAFDDEWSGINAKTARIYYDGEFDEIIFTGNTCIAPPVNNVRWVEIGVYAGDMSTTPATVPCKIDIQSRGGEKAEPKPDTYAQIMGNYNEMLERSEEVAAAAEIVTAAGYEMEQKANALKAVSTANPSVIYPDALSYIKPVVQFAPNQEGSGTPHPAGGGKNLLPSLAAGRYTIGDLTVVVNEDGSIVFNGENTGSGNADFAIIPATAYPAGKYTISGCPAGGSNSTYRLYCRQYDAAGSAKLYHGEFGEGLTITLGEGELLRFDIRIVKGSGAISNLVFRPQLEAGTVKTEYEPHKNIRLITYRTEGVVHRTKKNLVDVPSVTVKGEHPWANDYRDILLPPGTYTMRSYATQAGTITHVCMSVRLLSDPTKQIVAKSIDYANGDIVVTFTIPESERGVRVYFYSNLTADILSTECTFNNIVVEIGSKYTGHEYYQGDTFTVDFGQAFYGGVLTFANGLFDAYKYIELNGSENWTRRLSTSIGEYIFECNSDAPARSVIACNYGSVGGLDKGTNYINILTDGRVQARFDHIETLEEFVAMLAETPMQIVYVGDEENIIQLEAQSILALEGVNMVYTDGKAMTVEYNKSIVRAFEEALERIAALEAAAANT